MTEPYLGKPLKGRETADELNAQKNTLQQLYLKAFEQFAKILKPDGAVLFIFPKFSHAGKWISSECTAELKKLGFEEIEMLPGHKSLTYRRPDQKVAREIVKFKYH